jgi:hypothetical protein
MSPCTTNYAPITLPIGTLGGSSADGAHEYSTSLPPSPASQTPTPNSRGADPLAAMVAPLPPLPSATPADPAAATQPGQSSAGQPLEHVGWEQIAGRTWGEQMKTVLAGIGAIVILLQIVRKVV